MAPRLAPLGPLLAAGVAAAALSPGETPLAEWPMIMAHDSATTYLEAGLLNRWGKTQPSGGFTRLLDCGARAFDFRPGPVDNDTGRVLAHHARYLVHHEVSAMLDELVHWVAGHADGADDLVVLGITDFRTEGVKSSVQAMLRARGIPYYEDCALLKGLTVAEAMQKAGLPGGGHVLAIFDCWAMNYDPSVACSGFQWADGREVATEADRSASGAGRLPETYTCYNDSSTKDFPLARMYAYIDKVLAAGPPDDGRLYTVQALWQETHRSVEVGLLHGSSLLNQESWSGLNRLVAGRIRAGEVDVRRLGMLEVNNACDSSHEIVAAIREQRRAAAASGAERALLV